MPDVADAIFVQHLGGDILAEQTGQDSGDLIDRDRCAAADVEHVPGLLLAVQNGGEGLGYVLNMDEVAHLSTILEHQGRLIVQQA
ncbi:hypothetical protein D3C80_639110 [compost metagenome]